MIAGLLVAIGFLTRIPVPRQAFADASARTRSLCWYPAVGLLLGTLLCVFAWAIRAWPPMLAAAATLAAWVALTGALHLDGLADSADAWIGGLGDRERTLAIMKDPRSGPGGVVAVVLVLLLKFAALASAPSWPGLLLAPLLGRTALTVAFLVVPYVRAGGIGEGLRGAPRASCLSMVVLAAVGCLCLGGPGVASLTATLVVFAIWRRACLRRLGGMTGDTCGALAELTEAAVLVAVAVA
ncbi:adenosylcobinamide-GDP ribazoletransferase [Dyella sp. BiH032]|uniref:adenosylcobinamide-GDP ribazoletransferase n=1 Tax=Dyella sp. BiH032 TaxID=3075430 RepID=UPI0028934A68|nr:adenosylcobinamide-GDP ribazoletransferase [Dyella sp. BiH032]WNL45438.1 adenosylcobinamide-GDP ribazoletransferase [Dyella sp. BiH032]